MNNQTTGIGIATYVLNTKTCPHPPKGTKQNHSHLPLYIEGFNVLFSHSDVDCVNTGNQNKKIA